MAIEIAREGQRVVYHPIVGNSETGTVFSVTRKYVFVSFDNSTSGPRACNPEDLELARSGS